MSQPIWPDLSSWMDHVLPRGESLYSWEACESSHRGVGGVAFSGNRAAARLMTALAELAPGADGWVERVALDRTARFPTYMRGPVLLRAHRDERTGDIVCRGGALLGTAVSTRSPGGRIVTRTARTGGRVDLGR